MAEETINLFEKLGVTDERAHEIHIEIEAIRDNSEYLTEILSAIPETYDRESIIFGVFLCEMILENDDRLLPSSMNRATVVIMPDAAKEMLEELKTQPKGDPESN